MGALDLKLARDLWTIRGQAVAIALVIAAAVATMVLSTGTYRSLEVTRSLYYAQNRFADVFSSLKRAPDSTLREIASLPGIARAQTGIRQYALLDMPSVPEPVRGLIISVPSQGNAGLNVPVLRAGTWPDESRDDQILIHEAFAEGHNLHPGDFVDATINGKKRRMIVTGIALSPEFIYSLGPGDLVPDNRRFGILWMSRKALAVASNMQGAFNDLAVKLEPAAKPEAVTAEIDDVLDRYGGTGAYGRKDQLSDSFIESELNQLKTMTRIMPPIFLITAAFLLNISIGRLVETERGQIGLLKAMGYTNGAIGLHYIKTALAITFMGILMGWAVGLWMGRGMTQLYIEYYHFPILRYQVSAGVFFGAALISIAAAVLGAILSIYKAIQLSPAVAMAPPPPPVYRAGLLERLGLLRTATPAGRMIVRHIARWPLRSGFTILGIAMAIALLLSTLNFYDSVDAMLDSFFYRSNRQDITVSFTDIRPDSTKADFMHLPGVTSVELQRTVPARLISGHLQKRVGISGLEPGAELNRPLDIYGNCIFLPPTGIVLNERLAHQLKVRQGDQLQIEILEGRMPKLLVPVTGISREYIGLSAYMSRGALNRLLNEGPVANSAVILMDSELERALYQKLKQMPYVAGVASQRAAVSLFRKLIDENIFVMVTFYIVFASALAFGVVYNNARLTLIERAREFSFLRVLGFYRSEVAWVMGGEVALLTFFALPVGCLLGYGLVALIVAAFSSDLYRLPFVIEPSTYGYAMIAILIAAALSGILALYRLAELDLLSVLKERE